MPIKKNKLQTAVDRDATALGDGDMLLIFKADGRVVPVAKPETAALVNAAIERIASGIPTTSDMCVVEQFNSFTALSLASLNPKIMAFLCEWAAGDTDDGVAVAKALIRPM